MRAFARKIAVYYVALMFMGKRYQERVKNWDDTPALTFASFIVCMAALAVLQVAGNHGYFSWLMRLPYRAHAYPMFFLIFFINWRIWRVVSRPENQLGKDSRELAERLPVGTILVLTGISLVIFIWF